MKTYKSVLDLPAERRLKAKAGLLITKLAPKLATKVHSKPFSQHLAPHERLVRNGLQFKAIKTRDHDTLHHFLLDYWKSSFSEEFFSSFSHRYEDLFLRFHSGIVTEIAKQLSQQSFSKKIKLVELGCGDGKVLNYLAEHLPHLERLTGLDLSEKEITRCRQRYSHEKRMEFLNEDIFDWLPKQNDTPLILYTNGGVLEYFTRQHVKDLFRLVRSRPFPTWIALTETLGTDHLLETEPESFPYGQELAFSHNYAALLTEAGFQEIWRNDRLTKEGEENHPTRWLQLLGCEDPKKRKLP